VRELGQRVRDLFAPDRARMQALIESQIAQATEALDAGEDYAALSGGTPASLGPVSSPIAPVRAILSSTLGLSGPGSRRLAGSLVAALGAAVALAITVFSGTHGSSAGHAASAASGSTNPPTAALAVVAAPAVVLAPSAAPAVVPNETVEIRALPAWAHIHLDGRPVTNPYAGVVARDGAQHTTVVEAPGFFSRTDAFDADSDDTVRVIALRGRPRPAGSSGDAPPSNGAAATGPATAAIVTVRPIDPSNPYAH